jgi:hypothetical protein
MGQNIIVDRKILDDSMFSVDGNPNLTFNFTFVAEESIYLRASHPYVRAIFDGYYHSTRMNLAQCERQPYQLGGLIGRLSLCSMEKYIIACKVGNIGLRKKL